MPLTPGVISGPFRRLNDLVVKYTMYLSIYRLSFKKKNIYITKTINSFALGGRCEDVSVAFRKIVDHDSREL